MIKIFDFINAMQIEKGKFIKHHLLCFIPTIIYALSSIVYPSFVHLIIDLGVAKRNIKLIVMYCSVMALIGILMVIMDYIIKISYYKFNISLNIELKNKLFIKIVNSKYNTYSQKKVGDLCTCLDSDLGQITNFLTCEIPSIIKNLMTFLGISGLIIFYFHFLGLAIVLLAFSSVFLQRGLGNRVMEYSEMVREAVGVESSYSTEVLSNLEDVQMSGYISLVCKKYKRNNDILKKSAINNNNIINLSGTLGYAINTLLMLIILSVGSLNAYKKNMEIGTLFSLTIYAQRVVGPVVTLMSSYIEMKNTFPLFKRMQGLLEDAIELYKGKILPEKKLEKISYKEVSFGYIGTKRQLFYNFSLDISKGDIIGIVGHNGQGKSTILKLLFQIYKPESGEIQINDTYKIEDINLNYLHQNIGYVGQFPVLFSGEIRDIINPFCKKISDEEIKEIMRKVNLDIKLFDGTLDYILTENSTNISGGEKQKLALTRLIVEDKSWLLLDEPTSSMDFESEKRICSLLKELCVNRTAVIITHRPEILRICTRIIDLDKQ